MFVFTANLTSLVNPGAIIAGRQEMIVYYYPGETGWAGLVLTLTVCRHHFKSGIISQVAMSKPSQEQ